MPLMPDEQIQSFTSSLGKPSDRFLSKVLQHSITEKWRTPEAFLKHFPPAAIMRALAGADALRGTILVRAANVHEKLARKKSIESASEDLQLALQEGVTTAPEVMELFPPDEQVRYLAATDLWNYVFEQPFWLEKSGPERERATARMVFLLEAALGEKLLTLQKIADGMTFDGIARHLPADTLRRVLVHAMTQARDGKPLSESSLLEVVPLDKLTALVPLSKTWEGVFTDRLAVECGFVAKPAAPPVGEAALASDGAPTGSEAAAEPSLDQPQPSQEDEAWSDAEEVEDEEPAPQRLSGAPPKPPSALASPPPPPPSGAGEVADAEDAARQKAINKLTEIGRLPPSYQALSTPILLSIESMYADILDVDDDEEREAGIIDSFPNESHLRTSMLALIELLDPSIDVHKPPISDADAESLVKVVAFEERQRRDRGEGRRGSVRPPPPPSGRY